MSHNRENFFNRKENQMTIHPAQPKMTQDGFIEAQDFGRTRGNEIGASDRSMIDTQREIILSLEARIVQLEASIKRDMTQPVFPPYGWVCPKCGAGNAPSSNRCACTPMPPIHITC